MQSRPSEVTTRARRLRLTIAGLAAVGVLLAGPAARAAFLPLPANGSQVNNDVANAIDPNQDAGVSDVAGGTLTAGKVQVPWATFEQTSRDSQQIFGRVGGERRRGERHDATADLRREGPQAGDRRRGLPGRDVAGGREQRERLLLAAGRPRAARPDLADVARKGGPHAQHRPDPLRG